MFYTRASGSALTYLDITFTLKSFKDHHESTWDSLENRAEKADASGQMLSSHYKKWVTFAVGSLYSSPVAHGRA